MKYALVFPFGLIGLVCLAQGTTSPGTQPAAPPAILDYYRQHNFVTAFSTQEERQVLAANPGSVRDARLARVDRLMRMLESRVEPIDPGMTRSSASAHAVAYRSDLLRIKAVRVEDGGARVELERHTIGPAQNLHYVARYGELAPGDRMPDVDELRAIAGAQALVWTEVHRWRLVDGDWRRAAPTMHFVAR